MKLCLFLTFWSICLNTTWYNRTCSKTMPLRYERLWQQSMMIVTSFPCLNLVRLTCKCYILVILTGDKRIVVFLKWRVFFCSARFRPSPNSGLSFPCRYILLKFFDPTLKRICTATMMVVLPMDSDIKCSVYPLSVLAFTRKHGSSWLSNNSNSGCKFK